MNDDCVWWWIFVCEGHKCRECKDYISEHCDLGEQILEAYLETVQRERARKKGSNDDMR